MSGEALSFVMYGQPIGKASVRVVEHRAFMPTKTRNYMDMLGLIAKKAVREQHWEKTDRPVGLYVQSFYRIPKGKSKRWKAEALAGQILPTVKPDYDNILKIIGDSCTDIVYLDDKQICDGRNVKKYSEEPRVVVEFFRL